MRGQIWLVVNTSKKWMMLVSWWIGSSWLSHYHKGLTHHSYDCTSGEVGQDQIQTTKKTNTNYKKYNYKNTKQIQKRKIQTTKIQIQTTKKAKCKLQKTITNYKNSPNKKKEKTKPERYARIWFGIVQTMTKFAI